MLPESGRLCKLLVRKIAKNGLHRVASDWDADVPFYGDARAREKSVLSLIRSNIKSPRCQYHKTRVRETLLILCLNNIH